MVIAELVGLDKTVLAFDRKKSEIRHKLEIAVNRLAIEMVADLKANYLNGQVLHHQTGTLSRRTTPGRVESTDHGVWSSVSANTVYAAAHEFSFDGMVTVKDHLRMIKQAFGRQIAPREIQVSSHQRHMVLKERSFLRACLRAWEGRIREALTEAVK